MTELLTCMKKRKKKKSSLDSPSGREKIDLRLLCHKSSGTRDSVECSEIVHSFNAIREWNVCFGPFSVNALLMGHSSALALLSIILI